MEKSLYLTLDWSYEMDVGSWWMVKYECMIYQRVDYVLDHLYFKENSQSVRSIPNQIITSKTNVQIMLKADNNSNYNYN